VDNLPDLLSQVTPWGLTIGQTASVFVVAFILLAGWIFVRVVLRITGLLFRLGCAALLIFICGLISFMVLSNYAG
jgi:hypothetical protein